MTLTVSELADRVDCGCFRVGMGGSDGARLESVREALVDATTRIRGAIAEGDTAWELFAQRFEGSAAARELRAALDEQTMNDSYWTRLLDLSPTVEVGDAAATHALVCPQYNDNDGRVRSLEARVEVFLSNLLGRMSNLGCVAAGITYDMQHTQPSAVAVERDDFGDYDELSVAGPNPQAYASSQARDFTLASDAPVDAGRTTADALFAMTHTPDHPRYRTELCKHWIEDGVCARDGSCNFAHGTKYLRKVLDPHSPGGSSASRARAPSLSGSSLPTNDGPLLPTNPHRLLDRLADRQSDTNPFSHKRVPSIADSASWRRPLASDVAAGWRHHAPA